MANSSISGQFVAVRRSRLRFCYRYALTSGNRLIKFTRRKVRVRSCTGTGVVRKTNIRPKDSRAQKSLRPVAERRRTHEREKLKYYYTPAIH